MKIIGMAICEVKKTRIDLGVEKMINHRWSHEDFRKCQ